MERVNESKARLTFADIAGIDNVKAEVNELVAFLRNPKRFMDLGARSPSGVLLVGGPGTGQILRSQNVQIDLEIGTDIVKILKKMHVNLEMPSKVPVASVSP